MLYFAHMFFADHILNTIWTVYFAVQWWRYTPHDGRRNANSPAQQALIDAYIGQHQSMSEAERAAAAERVWRAEKAQALTIIILGWLIKVRSTSRSEHSPPLMSHFGNPKSFILPRSYIPLLTTSDEEATALYPSHAQIRMVPACLSRRTPTPRSLISMPIMPTMPLIPMWT